MWESFYTGQMWNNFHYSSLLISQKPACICDTKNYLATSPAFLHPWDFTSKCDGYRKSFCCAYIPARLLWHHSGGSSQVCRSPSESFTFTTSIVKYEKRKQHRRNAHKGFMAKESLMCSKWKKTQVSVLHLTDTREALWGILNYMTGKCSVVTSDSHIGDFTQQEGPK